MLETWDGNFPDAPAIFKCSFFFFLSSCLVLAMAQSTHRKTCSHLQLKRMITAGPLCHPDRMIARGAEKRTRTVVPSSRAFFVPCSHAESELIIMWRAKWLTGGHIRVSVVRLACDIPLICLHLAAPYIETKVCLLDVSLWWLVCCPLSRAFLSP